MHSTILHCSSPASLSVAGIPKLSPAAFVTDVDNAFMFPFPQTTANLQVIVNHLYREGLFESGDALVEEADLPADAAKATKETFSQMHEHLSQARLLTQPRGCCNLLPCSID